MTVQWSGCEVPGLLRSTPFFASDDRGSFTKLLSGPLGDQPPFQLDEVFWSRSQAGVIRGLHVQVPPRAGRKMIFVSSGSVRDFVVDLRRGSPAYGEVWETDITTSSGALVIPAGCAHGFEALTDDVVMVYLQEGQHDPGTDTGIRWDSAGIISRTPRPIVSARDCALPPLVEFESSFIWGH